MTFNLFGWIKWIKDHSTQGYLQVGHPTQRAGSQITKQIKFSIRNLPLETIKNSNGKLMQKPDMFSIKLLRYH